MEEKEILGEGTQAAGTRKSRALRRGIPGRGAPGGGCREDKKTLERVMLRRGIPGRGVLGRGMQGGQRNTGTSGKPSTALA